MFYFSVCQSIIILIVGDKYGFKCVWMTWDKNYFLKRTDVWAYILIFVSSCSKTIELEHDYMV